MNRTVSFIAVAGALAVLALLAAPRPQRTQPAQPEAQTQTQQPAAPAITAPLPAEAQGSSSARGLTLSGKLASAFVANGGAPNYLTLEVAAAPQEEKGPRMPANLVVVIDRSCSMAGQKLTDAIGAARTLVDTLHPDDRLAIVDYGSDVSTFPSTLADAAGKERLHAYLRDLDADGSTNIGGGLQAGALAAREHQARYSNNRLVLLSDGQPTVGITDPDGLARIVSRIREGGLTVTSLGVGRDFDERLMARLAEAGGGFYGDIGDSARLAEVFARELDQASRMVARDLELRLLVPANVRVEEVLGRDFRPDGAGARLRLYDLSSGLSNRLVVRFSVNESAGAALRGPVHAVLTWTDLKTAERVSAQVSMTATVTDDAQKALANADADVLAHAANAEAARQVRYAADLARQGKRDEADRHLSDSMLNLRRLFGASAESLAGASIEDSRKSLRGGDMNRAAKDMERKSLQSFGQSNAY